jgi:hypothetical protein
VTLSNPPKTIGERAAKYQIRIEDGLNKSIRVLQTAGLLKTITPEQWAELRDDILTLISDYLPEELLQEGRKLCVVCTGYIEEKCLLGYNTPYECPNDLTRGMMPDGG